MCKKTWFLNGVQVLHTSTYIFCQVKNITFNIPHIEGTFKFYITYAGRYHAFRRSLRRKCAKVQGCIFYIYIELLVLLCGIYFNSKYN